MVRIAIVKHIKSRNANYSDAINYLLFEHDEKTGKKIVDESGRSILRKEFYMDGLNCDPMSFDKECELTNMHFHKNRERSDIKSHHYIISFDPADVTENGLTGERAQAISIELAKQMFPGYQALVVTHTDGHNESGNIHTHIVINSVRKYAVDRQPYMDKPHEERAGYKHRSTDKFIKFFKKAVMDSPYADSRKTQRKINRTRTINHAKQRRNCYMTQEEFNVVFELQMRKCSDILAHKKKEYTGDNLDRLSAFKIAAALQNCDPKAALAGMMSKHVVSLYDMCYSSLLHFDMDQWDEKITDCINYLILLKALVKEEQAYGSH